MAYRVYLTVELPDDYATRDEAADAAILALQNAAEIEAERVVNPFTTIEARVFKVEERLSLPRQHEFVVDICDGCI